jgi:hypothetical protein
MAKALKIIEEMLSLLALEGLSLPKINDAVLQASAQGSSLSSAAVSSIDRSR